MRDWRVQHGQVIAAFAKYLNEKTDNFVLKGGTALYLCYNLDRFSEDIDLDGREKGLTAVVESFCAEKGYSCRVAKNTAMVERCFINYGSSENPLKIEASYRRLEIPAEETAEINGISVYRIDPLCGQKQAHTPGATKSVICMIWRLSATIILTVFRPQRCPYYAARWSTKASSSLTTL